MRFFCRFLAILAIYFFLTIPASAVVVIDEIMYDPKDTDASAGGEWIEVQNNDSTAVDLTKWIFFEADTNHGITADGAVEIPPGGYAVISRDLTAFKNYFTGFSGLLFKASFSLNDSEKLAMKINKEALVTDADSVTYTSDWGGKNDGNSLQKIDGLWKSALPTPGVLNISTSPSSANSSQQETSATSTGSGLPAATGTAQAGSSFPVEPQIFASAGDKKRTAIVGGTATFFGKVWGLKKEPIENARMLWNFGDGSTGEGKTVAHTYRYPGTYIVTLDASSGYYSASDRVTVEAVSADVVISSVGDAQSSFVELYNKSPHELDLSFWSIRAGNITFIIPEHTFVAAGAKIKFAGEVTGIIPKILVSVALYYPNGVPAHSYSPVAPSNISVAPKNNTKTIIASKTTKPTVLPAPKGSTLNDSRSTPNTILSQGTTVQKELPAENTQSALASSAHPETPSLFWWIVGVCALAVTGVASAFFTKRNPLLEPTKNEADAYEIIEETEDDKIPF